MQCEPPLGGGVGAGDDSSGGGIPLPPTNDQEVENAVRTAFYLDPDIPEDLCEVVAINRVVYLRGVVGSLDLKRRATQVATQVLGVDRVVNELRLAQTAP
jgi:osmotically-inducible protein OsmY